MSNLEVAGHPIPDYSGQHNFLARRPVFGLFKQVLAYDVIHCGALPEDDIGACLEQRLDVLAAGQQVFVAVTREQIVRHNELPSLAEGQQVVMVFDADIDVDDVLLGSVNHLTGKGYQVALADFDYGKNHNALLPFADFIKLSLSHHADSLLQELLTSLHEFQVRLIAEDVDTLAQFEHARDLGFDGFMGRFYCQPRYLDVQEIPAATVNLLRLVALVQEDGLDIASMERLINQDVVLSFYLLRYLNSAVFSLRRKVGSIRHAIVLLGQDEVRKWSALVSVLCVKNKPHELLRSALWRASMCELLCHEQGRGNPGTAFIVGLFSLLDAMFDISLQELLLMLPLVDEAKSALLDGRGDYAAVLACVHAYERGEWSAVQCSSLSPAQISGAYLRAVHRADRAMNGLFAGETEMIAVAN